MSLDVNISEPDEFNCIELHSSLKDLADELGFTDFDYHVEHINGGGRNNYIANIFRVVIRNVDTNISESVIVKTLVNTARQVLFHDLHKREVDVYKEILPKFNEIQETLEAGERIWFPECLHSSAEKTKEVIILKDLNQIGFVQDDTLIQKKELQFSKVQLILNHLAKFHALSFVYGNENKDVFAQVKNKFGDILFQENFLRNRKMRDYFLDSYDMSLNLIMDVNARKKLEKIRPKLLELLKIYHGPSKYNVLCHGDLWINNILFREENHGPTICFLDFQAMRYTSPAIDIIYFIYLCTTSEFRMKYFQTLLSTYYDSLKTTLKLHSIDVNVVYPKDDFEEDVKDKQPIGLVMALIELRIITTPSEGDVISNSDSESIPTEIPGPSSAEISESSSIVSTSDNINDYKFRVNDLVQECVDNGVLDQLIAKI